MADVTRRALLGSAAGLTWGYAAESRAATLACGALAGALVANGPHPSLGHHADTFGRLVGSWAGEYRVFTSSGTKSGKIRVSFGWILDGRAIQDSGWAYENLPDSDVPGSTLRIYDPGIEAWHIVFVDPMDPGHTEMVARRVGDDVIQQGYLDNRAIKWTFTDVRAKSFTWRGYHLADNGENWINEAEYRFRRVG